MPMTKEDRLKVADYLRVLCDRIVKRSWSPGEIDYVSERVSHFTRTAYKLEASARD